MAEVGFFLEEEVIFVCGFREDQRKGRALSNLSLMFDSFLQIYMDVRMNAPFPSVFFCERLFPLCFSSARLIRSGDMVMGCKMKMLFLQDVIRKAAYMLRWLLSWPVIGHENSGA